MKKILYLIPLAIFTILATSAFAQETDFTDPVQYFSYFGNEHNKVINKNMEYVQYSVHSDNVQEIGTKRLELIAVINETIGRVQKVPPFEKDTKMKDEMLEVLSMYKNSFEIEFNNALTLKENSKESYEAMEEYINAMDVAEKKLDKASDRFQKASTKFAEDNEITLIKNEANDVVGELNRLNNYHRKLYLKYFKVSKKNAEFWDALEKQNAGLMEKKRKELQEDCNSTLKIVTLMPAFKGDTEYKDATLEIVNFFKKLADNDYVKMVEITRKGDANFTQADVDTYNKVVEIYNTQTPMLSQKFNIAGNNLLRKHIPKPIATKRT